ncbi:MAG TPA: TIM barrel protein [Rubrobacter sp.]|nr:TIM barrel protein [Rubrobacter sp.]
MAPPIIFSTGSLYPFGLERVYGWISEAGYDGVEIMMDERWDTHQEEYLKGLVERHGIPILALHPPLRRGAWGLAPGETMVRVARLAQKIQVPVVVAHPPPPGKPLARWKDGPLREAREYGVTVAVENMPRNEARGIIRVRRGSCYLPEDLADVGDVTLDTSHAGASKVDVLRAHSVLATQLSHVHLSDSNLEAGRDEHRLPGKGRLPLKPLLAALSASGYPGAVSLELKPWPLGTPDTGTILERMRAALAFAREGLEGR